MMLPADLPSRLAIAVVHEAILDEPTLHMRLRFRPIRGRSAPEAVA